MKVAFKIKDKVIHKREGLSEIISSTKVSDKDYFLLKALRGDGEMIYVPVEGCENIIRPIMSSKQATDLLKKMKDVVLEINANTKQRRDAYKKILNTGDINDIAYLSRQLYHYKKENNGKLGPMDIEMLTRAHNMLMDELMETFKKTREKIEIFIEKKIG